MNAQAKPHGQVRRSQLLMTFGPGALIDLPKHSVLVSGLDDWRQVGPPLDEPRLLEKIRRFLPDIHELREPPIDPDPQRPAAGVTIWQFPEWFVTQDFIQGRARRLVHRRLLTRGQLEDEDNKKKKHSVVPVRFVRACPKGHIGDIDWYAFVHHDDPHGACRRRLWLEEQGSSGDLASLWVRCDCGKRRSLAAASKREFKALGYCDGSRTWLGRTAEKEDCDEINRLLIRSASHAYFPQLLSVISLPEQNDPVMDTVIAMWHSLQRVDSTEKLDTLREMLPDVETALQGLDNTAVLNAIRARRIAGNASSGPALSVKDAELEILTAKTDPIGRDHPDSVFYARVFTPALPVGVNPRTGTPTVDRVLLIHRLREVAAQVGFTRFEAVSPKTDGELPELDIGVERAALGLDTRWLPAVDNRGEGIFIGFRRDAIQQWLHQPAVIRRHEQLLQGFKAWLAEHPKSQREFPGADYLLLHTLSHLLLTVIALDCGYPASSIRERVYASDLGYGILLYTASPDAEGTLGGLVKAGERIHDHLQAALEWGRLCSNDPVCAGHRPDDPYERRFLHGAACHGCLLIAETSCEQGNDFLDRTLVVPTVDDGHAAFFPDPP